MGSTGEQPFRAIVEVRRRAELTPPTCRGNTRSHHSASFLVHVLAQFYDVHTGHIHKQADAVQQRATDSRPISDSLQVLSILSPFFELHE